MKKKLLLLFTCSAMVASFSNAQLAFGPQAGLNLANMSFKDNDGSYNDDNKMLIGFNVGGGINYAFSDALSLRTSVLFSQKGVRSKYESESSYDIFGTTYTTNTTSDNKITLGYLEIPIALRINLELGDANLFIEGGPYLGFGIAGKQSNEYESTTTVTDSNGSSSSTESGSSSDDINWGSADTDDLKPFDFGVYPGVGMRFDKFEFSVNYKLGLSNISTYTENGNSVKNSVIGVNLGFWLGDI